MPATEEKAVPFGDEAPREEPTTEPPLAYPYPHSTDHPPVAPVPDDLEHEVESFGGAPEGGT